MRFRANRCLRERRTCEFERLGASERAGTAISRDAVPPGDPNVAPEEPGERLLRILLVCPRLLCLRESPVWLRESPESVFLIFCRCFRGGFGRFCASGRAQCGS